MEAKAPKGRTGRPKRENYHKLTITLPLKDCERLKDESERLGLSTSQTLERCIYEYLSSREVKTQKKINKALRVKLRLIELIVGNVNSPTDEKKALETFEMAKGIQS